MASEKLPLSSKIAIVTGSGRQTGIGATIARALARNGSAVTIHHVSDSSAPRAAEVAQNIQNAGGKATVVQADISSPDGARKVVAATLEAFGTSQIDILVNNAGGGALGNLVDASPEQLANEFGINTFGPLYMSQAVVELGKMPSGGRIINIGSVASKLGLRGMAVYSAAKAALDSFTEALAEELGRSHGITVNCVAPGPVRTDSITEVEERLGTDVTEPLRAKARGSGRLADPEDISDVVEWLATDKSRWVTAQYISVSAGINGTS